MTYVFDIDSTICTTNGSDYENSVPIANRVQKINDLYDQGNIIFFLTARGMGRSNNKQIDAYREMYTFTKKQLDSWGLKYHQLFLGKPNGDIFVDDKGMNDEDFFGN
jgi:hypothetical protein